MSFPAQCRAARGRALLRRSAARARRRGQRQDARHHREDRAPGRARASTRAHRRDHVHQQGRARDARARAGAAGGAGQGRRSPQTSRSPRSTRSGLEILRSEAKALGPASPASRSSIRATSSRSSPSSCATADRPARARRNGGSARWKNALVSPAAALDGRAERRRDRRGARVRAATTTRSRAYQAVDFDDLIVLPLALLERDAAAARRWRERCAHVLVDEYQDTNPAQYRLFRAAGRRTRRRSPSSATTTRRSTAGAARRSTTCARCRATIPDAQGGQARAELPLDRAHPALGERADREQPEALRQEAVERARPSATRSASRPRPTTRPKPRCVVAPARRASRSSSARRYADFAILYRGNHQAQRVRDGAARAERAVRDLRRQSIFERTEIKDIVAYLRLIANDDDDPAFLRAVDDAEARHRRRRRWQRLGDDRRARGTRACSRPRSPPELARAVPARQREGLGAFCALINDLRYRARARARGAPARRAGRGDRLRGLARVDRSTSATRTTRSQSVRDFVGWLVAQGRGRRTQPPRADADDRADHDARGPRRARRRTPCGCRRCTRRRASSSRTCSSSGSRRACCRIARRSTRGNVDEERRLMYVGVTRAQQTLHLSFCRSAQARGGSGRLPRRRASSASSRRRTCASRARRCRRTKPRRRRRRAASG